MFLTPVFNSYAADEVYLIEGIYVDDWEEDGVWTVLCREISGMCAIWIIADSGTGTTDRVEVYINQQLSKTVSVETYQGSTSSVQGISYKWTTN